MSEAKKYDIVFNNILNTEITETENEFCLINTVYKDTGFKKLTAIETLYEECDVIDFENMRTGDIARYTKDNENIFSIVTGVIERNISYISPSGKIIKADPITKNIEDFSFCCGFNMQDFFA